MQSVAARTCMQRKPGHSHFFFSAQTQADPNYDPNPNPNPNPNSDPNANPWGGLKVGWRGRRFRRVFRWRLHQSNWPIGLSASTNQDVAPHECGFSATPQCGRSPPSLPPSLPITCFSRSVTDVQESAMTSTLFPS